MDFRPFSDFSEAADEVMTTLHQVLGVEYRLIRCIAGAGRIGTGVATYPADEAAAIREADVISCYAGAPLIVAGSVFGLLSPLDPIAKAAPEQPAHTHLLASSARMLSTLLSIQITADNSLRRAERAEAEALVDELTGLYNRRGWNRLVEQEATRSQRYGVQAAIFVMDVDDLKTVNDTAGHAAGDEAIRRAAAAIREVTRDHDIAARLGGDEFALLAVETSALDAQTLHERLEAAFIAAGVNVSIGRTHCGKHGGFAQAIAFADELMYEQKANRAGVAAMAPQRC